MDCLEEPVHDATAGGHENTEPPPVISPDTSWGEFTLEHGFVVHWELAALDLAAGCGGSKRIQSSGWEHFGRRVCEVKRHERGAVSFVKVETGDFVVAVFCYGVLLENVSMLQIRIESLTRVVP